MYLSTNGSSLEYKPERPFAEEFDPESYTNLSPAAIPPRSTTKTGWTASAAAKSPWRASTSP